MSGRDTAPVARAAIPVARAAMMTTAHGVVEIQALSWSDEPPYVVLRHPQPGTPLRLRPQAQCLTSTAFDARMCDCRDQIRAGVRMAASVPGAVLVYVPQEGRGHGLLGKVEVMAAMNTGLDLPAAQRAAGRPDSRLDFRRIPQILRHLDHAGPVVLITQSPAKIDAVRVAGVRVQDVQALRDAQASPGS